MPDSTWLARTLVNLETVGAMYLFHDSFGFIGDW